MARCSERVNALPACHVDVERPFPALEKVDDDNRGRSARDKAHGGSGGSEMKATSPRPECLGAGQRDSGP